MFATSVSYYMLVLVGPKYGIFNELSHKGLPQHEAASEMHPHMKISLEVILTQIFHSYMDINFSHFSPKKDHKTTPS